MMNQAANGNPIPALTTITAIVLLLGTLAIRTSASDPADLDLERRFTVTVRPFLERYCLPSHSGEKRMVQFDLRVYSSVASVVWDHPRWARVLERLTAKQMSPEQAKQQPAPEAHQKVIDWIDALRKKEGRKNAGDPGLVVARRLSNAEYNYTIRDLTGVDLRPARESPVDLARDVLNIFVRAVFVSLRRRARSGIRQVQCGAVTFVQRFGDALNLNVHFHTLVLDQPEVPATAQAGGVYAEDARQRVCFHVLPPLDDAEVARVTARIAR